MSTTQSTELMVDAEFGVTRGIVYGRAGVGFGTVLLILLLAYMLGIFH